MCQEIVLSPRLLYVSIYVSYSLRMSHLGVTLLDSFILEEKEFQGRGEDCTLVMELTNGESQARISP